jgi:hypothetical protein
VCRCSECREWAWPVLLLWGKLVCAHIKAGMACASRACDWGELLAAQLVLFWLSGWLSSLLHGPGTCQLAESVVYCVLYCVLIPCWTCGRFRRTKLSADCSQADIVWL